MIKEACVESLQEALQAEKQGADQIELCGRLDLGGITPELTLVEEVMENLNIHVKVMVRPRGGNFIYSQKEVDVMSVAIEFLKNMGVQEVVLGLLTDQDQIDIENTKRLVALAQPMRVTFHKAIDEISDPIAGVKQILKVPGITGILTSGGKSTAKEGAVVIKEMIAEAGDSIQVIAAGKITNENLKTIDQLIGAKAYHGKLIVGDLNR